MKVVLRKVATEDLPDDDVCDCGLQVIFLVFERFPEPLRDSFKHVLNRFSEGFQYAIHCIVVWSFQRRFTAGIFSRVFGSVKP